MFYDRDQDGDQDLFLVGLGLGESEDLVPSEFTYFVDYQENIGTAEAPEFSPRVEAFDTLYIPLGFFYPACGDLNGDGIPDLIAMAEVEYYSEIQHLLFYLSDGDEFLIKRESDFDLPAFVPYSNMFPYLADLDVDGDLDILISGFETTNLADTSQSFTVMYAKNIGTPQEPEFLGWFYNPYEIIKDTIGEIMQIADIDVDGDMDVISLAVRNEAFTLVVKENISENKHRPSFSDEMITPYNMPEMTDDYQFLDFSLIDIDGDSDQDLFIPAITDDGFMLDYYENVECATSREEIFIEICEGSIYEGYDQSGVYTDTYSNSEGCDSIRTLNLTVHPIYDLSERYMRCDGDTLILGDQSITTSGNYVTTYQSSKGCDSTVTANVTFYIIDASVTLNENELSAVQGYDDYQWINCTTGEDIAGQTYATFTPEESGSYAVRITTPTGCEETSGCMEVVVSSTEYLMLSKGIGIYPNPSNGQFIINNFTGQRIDRINVIDFEGRNLKELLIGNDDHFNIQELSPGGYLILVKIGEYIIPKKVWIM